ncbi:TetR family transcriptional regulator [Nocardioides perillae]|uniref:AcrR family transcriptional regulator n=1 Tax=Nocardioides perillae TaxID=1119534 RepID=A0A7Y9UVF5_9ACTN|nr:AcrR family transcriptional regulator [Nocardioides perillae]
MGGSGSEEPREPVGRADAARSRLAQAAVEAFAARGFHGTTTRDIAAAAGMSPAALYVHHRSKESLLFALSLEGHRRTLALVEAAATSPGGVVERLGRLVADFVRHHAVNNTSARVVNYELAALAPEHLDEITALRHRIEQVVVALVTEGVAAGELSTPDPRMSAAAVTSLGIDVARWFRRGEGWAPDEVADHYRLLVLRMLGADPG